MAFVRVTKSNAWTCWQEGLIAGGNAGMADVDRSTPLLGTHTGLNALRLWINYNNGGYWLVPTDYVNIANNGWNQTSPTTVGARNPQLPSIRTYADVANKIQSVLDACGKVGIGVILTLDWWKVGGDRMWASKGADAPIVGSDGYVDPNPYYAATTASQAQQYLANFWKATATRFGSHQALIGYDILNEPGPDQVSMWATAANLVTDAIRSVDASTPIIVECAGSASKFQVFTPVSPTTGQIVLDPLLANSSSRKIVFSAHCYDPVGSTHNGLTDWSYESMGMPYPPAESWNLVTNTKSAVSNAAQLAALYYQEMINFKQTYKVPMYIGEFSYINQSGSPQYYQPDPTNPHRIVTSILPHAGSPANSVELTMGLITDGQGFRIDSAPDTAGVYTNTVLVTVSPLPASQRSAAVPAATYDAWDQTVTKLAISDIPVTIARNGTVYVVPIPNWGTIGSVSLPPNSPTVPVALISLKPSSAHQLLQTQSRTTFAKQIIRMCQDHGFSWTWHATDDGTDWWTPTPDILAVFRDAAMGRKINA